MAFTLPTQAYKYLKTGTAVQLYSALASTGGKTPFALLAPSGQYWAQLTLQCVVGSVTTITADIEVDLTGVDANFVPLITGLNFFAAPAYIVNLSGGNARYRLNIKTFVDGGATGADFWGVIA